MTTTGAATRPPHSVGARGVALRWTWVLAAALAAATVLSLAGRAAWFLELLSHFRVQLLCGAVLALALFAACRSGRGVLLGLLLCGVNGAPVLPLYLPPERSAPSDASGRPLRLLIANVYTLNTRHERLLELVREERPDLLLLQETDRGWLASLEVLAREYPHRLAEPRGDNFGIALLSKRPFLRAEQPVYGRADLPSLHVAVEHGGEPVEVVLTHPLPPGGAARNALRDDQLRAVAAAVARLGPRTVLAGDLNTTRWSPAFADLLAASGLRDGARGFGPRPTWPATLPLPLRIGIDHCLVGAGLRVVDLRVGPDIGSDHLPLLVDLR